MSKLISWTPSPEKRCPHINNIISYKPPHLDPIIQGLDLTLLSRPLAWIMSQHHEQNNIETNNSHSIRRYAPCRMKRRNHPLSDTTNTSILNPLIHSLKCNEQETLDPRYYPTHKHEHISPYLPLEITRLPNITTKWIAYPISPPHEHELIFRRFTPMKRNQV